MNGYQSEWDDLGHHLSLFKESTSPSEGLLPGSWRRTTPDYLIAEIADTYEITGHGCTILGSTFVADYFLVCAIA